MNKIKLRRLAYNYAEKYNCSLHDAYRYIHRFNIYKQKRERKK
jgi:hypothetical protein